MGKNRWRDFEDFLVDGEKRTFGALRMQGNEVYSYAMRIALVDRDRKIVLKRLASPSRTTTCHLGAVHAPPGWVGLPVLEVGHDMNTAIRSIWPEVKEKDYRDVLDFHQLVHNADMQKLHMDRLAVVADYVKSSARKRKNLRGLIEIKLDTE